MTNSNTEKDLINAKKFLKELKELQKKYDIVISVGIEYGQYWEVEGTVITLENKDGEFITELN